MKHEMRNLKEVFESKTENLESKYIWYREMNVRLGEQKKEFVFGYKERSEWREPMYEPRLKAPFCNCEQQSWERSSWYMLQWNEVDFMLVVTAAVVENKVGEVTLGMKGNWGLGFRGFGGKEG